MFECERNANFEQQILNFDKQIVIFDSICLSSTSKNRSLKSFSTLVLKHLGKYLLKKS